MMIVCIEGIDACGKDTQSHLLAERLGCESIRFPDYESPTGILINQHLHSKWAAKQNLGGHGDHLIDAMVFQSLMLTNRMEAAARIHRYRMEQKNLVLNRYWPSGVVYGQADGLNVDWLLQVHVMLPQAHHYVLIDIPAEVSTMRRPERRDRYEMQPGLMEIVASGYLELWSRMHDAHMSAWHMVDGTKKSDQVHEAICDAIGVD
jgi:dTMP kinase